MRFAARTLRLAAVVIPLGLAAGCSGSKGDKEPTTMPSTMAKGDMPMAPMTMEGATHTVSSDQAYYKMTPMQSAPPEGMLKAGTKVKLLVPGAMYSKVEIGDGKTVYTSTEALQPM